jgi:uncharacterized protein YllA (UPF0747 family)
VNQDRLRTIEQRDAELARIIQEEEKIKLEKYKQHKKQLRQLSVPTERSADVSSYIEVYPFDLISLLFIDSTHSFAPQRDESSRSSFAL